MSRWTCPACEREFARAGQSHVCVPGVTVDESFAARPAQRAIYDAVVTHLRSLGPVHEDAVSVGVFLKRERKVAELRPMARGLSLALFLPRTAPGPSAGRRAWTSGDRVGFLLKLTSPADVDDELRCWLTEAYRAAG